MCDIIMLIFGIITLVRGKFLLTRAKEVRGVPARIIGVVLMLPFPLSFALGILLGVALTAQGKSVDNIRSVAVGIGFGVTALCFLAAVGIAFAYARPIVKYAPDRDSVGLDEEELPGEYGDHFNRKADRAAPGAGESEDYTEHPRRRRKPADDRIQE